MHDLRNPNQASGRVPLHPHPPVQTDPLHVVALLGELGADRVQRGNQACGGQNRQGRVQGAGRDACCREAALHEGQLPPPGLLSHKREVGGPKSLRQPSVRFQGEAPSSPSQGSMNTAGASPASGKAKLRRPSASGGEQPTRKSPLASSSGRQPAGAVSQVSEVAEASLADAMSKVPSSYEP